MRLRPTALPAVRATTRVYMCGNIQSLTFACLRVLIADGRRLCRACSPRSATVGMDAVVAAAPTATASSTRRPTSVGFRPTRGDRVRRPSSCSNRPAVPPVVKRDSASCRQRLGMNLVRGDDARPNKTDSAGGLMVGRAMHRRRRPGIATARRPVPSPRSEIASYRQGPPRRAARSECGLSGPTNAATRAAMSLASCTGLTVSVRLHCADTVRLFYAKQPGERQSSHCVHRTDSASANCNNTCRCSAVSCLSTTWSSV